MICRIIDYRDFGYEIHKNGLFWRTYIYKKESPSSYELINILRSLVEPSDDNIHRNIDQIVCVCDDILLE